MLISPILVTEWATFIGTGGGCDDEGAETFPAKENERTKNFSKKIEGVTG